MMPEQLDGYHVALLLEVHQVPHAMRTPSLVAPLRMISMIKVGTWLQACMQVGTRFPFLYQLGSMLTASNNMQLLTILTNYVMHARDAPISTFELANA
jgi:hypothetical protein